MQSATKKTITKLFPRRWVQYAKRIKSHYTLNKGFRSRLSHYIDASYGKFPNDKESDLALLSMNSHILDKGLQRTDWSRGHGKKAYQTVKQILNRYKGETEATVKWAADIIKEYGVRQETGEMSTDFSIERSQSPCSSDELLEQLNHRRSCRQYLDKDVENESLAKIVEASLEAPWSCSRQALHIYVSVKPPIVSEGLSCFRGFTSFSKVPAIIVYCVDIRPYTFPKEVFVPHLDVGLAAGHGTLMASALGLSMTFLSWGSRTDEGERRLRRLFDIPEYYEIVVGATCGYPKQIPRKPARKAVKETIEWV